MERVIGLCIQAADTMLRIERQFDAIEKRYNKLIEQKTIFASRAAARIRYVLQEGAQEDQTIVFVDMLNRSGRKEELIRALSERIPMSRPYSVMAEDSMYRRRLSDREKFTPQAVAEESRESEKLDSFVLKPLYTQKELELFKRKNQSDGVFRTTKDTVRTVEDLEKLFFIWQEATETAQTEKEITLGEEQKSGQGLRFTELEIRED